jgi:hypothetical protein
MAGDTIRVLCLHGLNRQEATQDVWQPQWEAAIRTSLERAGDGRRVEFSFPTYDELFAQKDIPWTQVIGAFGELLGSGLWHSLFSRGLTRGIGDLPESLRWTAGMVVLWAQDEQIRRQTRERVADAVAAFRPDVFVAHSLGSLIAYDALTTPATSGGMSDGILLTIGAQIGNPFVRNEFGGYLRTVPAKRWVNVHNPEDRVLTTPVRLVADNFVEVVERFGAPDYADGHSAVGYLETAGAGTEVWRRLAGVAGAKVLTPRVPMRPPKRERAPNRRALLVGIEDYPDPANRLQGCVNDTFLVSSVLQEAGFAAEDIRLLLNERAQATTIRERIMWLLEDPRPGDVRFFYFSGHGAQVPAYGPEEVVDSLDEVLVAHDFDWSEPARTGILDDDLQRLYAQLPYGTTFVMMLDCCHSGGVSRAGQSKARGLTAPDDIRHRALRWDGRRETWVQRDFPDLNAGADDPDRGNGRFFGRAGDRNRLAVRRIGRAARQRNLPDRRFRAVTTAREHRGPYLPMILEACAEQELAYEYKHGAHSYGAFTYTVARILRQRSRAGRSITFEELVRASRLELPKLGYDQTPSLTGPTALRGSPVPWRVEPPARRRPSRRKRATRARVRRRGTRKRRATKQ